MPSRGARTAGIYARISLDRREGEGVGRQLADCRALAAERGWKVGGEYVDNDLSAFRAKRRPEWDRLLTDLEAGRINAVVAYHPDRTYRRLADLENLIDVVERNRAEVATVKAGDLDLSTATGRMQARIVAAVARHESERIGERVSRAKAERAAQGRPPGGGLRAFGYQPGGMALHPVEAPLVAEAAAEVAAGGSLFAVAVRWNEAGVTTTAGNPWEVTAVRRVLTNPRIAGLRTYRGEVVGKAAWPAIIDRKIHDRILAVAAGRRRGRPRDDRWLLSGLIACPHCGNVLHGSETRGVRTYKCSPGPTRRRCGRASVAADPCDQRILDTVAAWLADPPPQLETWLKGPDVDPTAEQAALREHRAVLARNFAAGHLTETDFQTALDTLNARLAELDTATPAAPRSIKALAGAWRRGSNPDRRAVIEALVECPMPLSTERMPNPADRLTIEPRWG